MNNPYALIISGTENSLEPTVEIKMDQIPNDGAQVTLRAIVSSNCGTNQIIKDVFSTLTQSHIWKLTLPRKFVRVTTHIL